MSTREVSVATSRGAARATLHRPAGRTKAHAIVVLLHGAGTDTAAAPLPVMAGALAGNGVLAIRFDQPYRVAGRRAPDPAHLLDRALMDALPQLTGWAAPGAVLAVAGRSSGARVACRTVVDSGAVAVACLGFPWRPPQGRASAPKQDRGAELRFAAASVPVLVVQGERDPFGMPRRGRNISIRRVPGVAHVPTEAMALAAADWLLAELRQREQPVRAPR